MGMKTDHLKTCDILLYKGKGLTSWLIQVGTGSRYNHVAVVVHPGMNLAIESNTGHQAGVRALDLRKLVDSEIDVVRVKSEFTYDPKQVISYLVGHLGAKYDWWGVARLGALKLFQLKEQSNKWQKEQDYFCSELVYEAFKETGLDIVPQVSEADVTSPGDIAASERVEKV